MNSACVIWLNGAFGVGKTTVARVLASRLPNAIIFDPELIGIVARRVVPPQLRSTDDFQDLPLWRRLTRSSIDGLLDEYRRPLVVPMTLVDPGYFDEIVGGLRRAGVSVHHFALAARPETIRGRLSARRARTRGTDWALDRVDRCSAALESPLFANHIAADTESVDAIVSSIFGRLPL